MIEPRCDRCQKPLEPGRGGFHVVSIVAVADPAPPGFTEEELARDLGAEIRRLVDGLGSLEEDEALDQVYRRKVLRLCSACFRPWFDDPLGS